MDTYGVTFISACATESVRVVGVELLAEVGLGIAAVLPRLARMLRPIGTGATFQFQ